MTNRFFITLKSIFSGFLLASVSVVATDRKPWLGELLEFEWKNQFEYQQYSAIDTNGQRKGYANNDLFLTSSLEVALPNLSNGNPDYSLEIELTQASTRRQSGGIDNFTLTGKRMIFDDIAGDPFALVAGISYIQAFKPSLNDVSSFHHGHTEGEFFLSAGKEYSESLTCSDVIDWKNRWWITGGVGIGSKGAPWLRLDGAFDYRLYDYHECRFFVDTLWGLGNRSLHLHRFKGYGAINHQSVDIGLRYKWLFENFGSFSILYANRVYARNFPAHANLLIFEICYEFGLIN